jgi:hypothetical protein
LLNRDVVRSALSVLALLTVLAVGCGGGPGSTPKTDGGLAIRGRIVDLNARSLLEIESLTIRAESSEDYTVEAEGVPMGQFTPSHLREHMVSGLVVTVTYHEEDGRLVLDGISD